MADPWRSPSAKRWVRHVLDEMAPKLEGSAFTISLVPGDREGDVKFWVELGASIMMDKPIIAVVMGDAPIPERLERVADEIVRCPEGVDPGASGELAEAIERTYKRLGQWTD
jgi:hypothetical protein